MLKSTPEWSKSYPVRPRNHLKSHELIDEKPKFKVSYENDGCPIPMSSLLGWEYSRKWLKERDEFFEARGKRNQRKHISNDFGHWLEKRKPKEKFSCRPQGVQNLAPKKQRPKPGASNKSEGDIKMKTREG